MTETMFTPSLERVSCVLSILIFHLLKERKKEIAKCLVCEVQGERFLL
jgi:hypothetical protein